MTCFLSWTGVLFSTSSARTTNRCRSFLCLSLLTKTLLPHLFLSHTLVHLTDCQQASHSTESQLPECPEDGFYPYRLQPRALHHPQPAMLHSQPSGLPLTFHLLHHVTGAEAWWEAYIYTWEAFTVLMYSIFFLSSHSLYLFLHS